MRARLHMAICLLMAPLALAGCSLIDGTGDPSGAATPATPEERIWAQLERRPVKMPELAAGATCPLTSYHSVAPPPDTGADSLYVTGRGDGPVYLEVGGVSGILLYDAPSAWHSHEWGGGNAFFHEHAPNNNFVLIRGHQLDGPNELRIGEEDVPPTEYRLVPTPWAEPTGWTGTPVYPRLRAPGCYAFQVDGVNQTDGTSFSYQIVFQATPAG